MLAAFLGLLVTRGQRYYPAFFPSFTIVPFSLIGLAFSIFLGFRNSARYERYWEGRRLWGQLIIDTRSLCRRLLTLMGPAADTGVSSEAAEAGAKAQSMVRKLIAFTYALKHHLRGTVVAADLAKFWPAEDLAPLLSCSNLPDAILLSLSADLRHCCGPWMSG